MSLEMKLLFGLISSLALATAIVPSLLYASGIVSQAEMNLVMSSGTVVWFIAAPLWSWSARKRESA